MKKLIIILASALLFAACGNQSVKTVCANPGITPVNVKYGLSDVTVRPHTAKVRRGRALRFRPKESNAARKAREEKGLPVPTVSIQWEGAAKCSDWNDGSGTGEFDVCADKDAEIDLVCKYDVSVSGVGSLDPYARIIPD